MGSREKGVLFIVLGVIIALASALQAADFNTHRAHDNTYMVAGRVAAIILFAGLSVYLMWKGRKVYREGDNG
jgi:hypothetical protein